MDVRLLLVVVIGPERTVETDTSIPYTLQLRPGYWLTRTIAVVNNAFSATKGTPMSTCSCLCSCKIAADSRRNALGKN